MAGPGDSLAALFRSVVDELPEVATGRALARRLQETCLSPTPAAVAGSGQLLLRVGFVGHAETIFDALGRFVPAMPAGLAGLAQVAMQRKTWVCALRRWDALVAAFPTHANPYWLAARARVLIELGRDEDARAILEGLSRECAHQPHGRIGLAQLAMHRRLWREALELWDEVLARYPQHDSVPFSKTTRAGVLLQLGCHAQAETALREVIHTDPWMVGAHVVLMDVLAAMGRYDEAIGVPQVSMFADAAIPTLCRATLAILLQRRRLDAARAEFTRALERTVDIESISLLFESVPLLYERWQRTEIWLDLLRRLDALQTRAAAAGWQAYGMLRARLKLCLEDHGGYLHEVRQFEAPEHFGEFASSAPAVAAALASPAFPDYGKRKVFGIGLSRTGTTTLAAALQTLGMSTLHWTNPLTCRLVSDQDLHLFDAFTDTPVCVAFEELYYQFPASRFIYTIRPLDSWTRSLVGHWRRELDVCGFEEFRRQAGRPGNFCYGSEYCRINQTLYLNHADLRQAYGMHDRRVRRFFSDKPQDRLLVFDVFAGHGWAELCAFLGVQAPAAPFPFENRSPPGPAGGQ